jgi:hypothetical protein
MENNFSSDMWIFDSGASCHYCLSIEQLVEVEDIGSITKIGNMTIEKASSPPITVANNSLAKNNKVLQLIQKSANQCDSRSYI